MGEILVTFWSLGGKSEYVWGRGGRSWWNLPTLLYFSPFWYLVFTCPRPPLWHLTFACPVLLHFLWHSLIPSLLNFISPNEDDFAYPQGQKQSYWINFIIWYVLTECLINASYFKKLGLQKWLIQTTLPIWWSTKVIKVFQMVKSWVTWHRCTLQIDLFWAEVSVIRGNQRGRWSRTHRVLYCLGAHWSPYATGASCWFVILLISFHIAFFP